MIPSRMSEPRILVRTLSESSPEAQRLLESIDWETGETKTKSEFRRKLFARMQSKSQASQYTDGELPTGVPSGASSDTG